jgi:hypothetical protein
MEVCPTHSLEAMKESKKWYLRAKAIDNQTYRRAMAVSDYNKGRSVSELKLKDWSYGTSKNMRPDSYWVDDRYDPTVVRHPHRNNDVNFPDLEFKDIFGGNWGHKEETLRKKHALNFWSNKSRAMEEDDAKSAPSHAKVEKPEEKGDDHH